MPRHKGSTVPYERTVLGICYGPTKISRPYVPQSFLFPHETVNMRGKNNLRMKTSTHKKYHVLMIKPTNTHVLMTLLFFIYYLFIFITFRRWGQSTSYNVAHPACGHKGSTHLSPVQAYEYGIVGQHMSTKSEFESSSLSRNGFSSDFCSGKREDVNTRNSTIG